MKVLVIEDNKQLASTIRHNLKSNYVVDIAHTGSRAEDFAYSNDYDLILLDLNLPDMDGALICKGLRENGDRTPILALTGRTKLHDKVQTLNIGADDYLTKPFQFEELYARMRSLLRKSASFPPASPKLVFVDLSLDPISRVVERQGKPVNLRGKEFQLLEYLLRNQGAVLSRGQIIEHVWKTDTDPLTNTVDVHINALRQKICYPFNTRLIKTVHGLGYMMKEHKVNPPAPV